MRISLNMVKNIYDIHTSTNKCSEQAQLALKCQGSTEASQ